MKKFLSVLIFVLISTFCIAQNDILWEIYHDCNVYSSQHNSDDEFVFTALADEKIVPLQKYGNQDVKVKR